MEMRRPRIGEGVYTLAEVSKYTGVKDGTLRTWFVGRSDENGRGPIFTSDWDKIDNDFAVSFLNLIEAHVAKFFKEGRISPKNIRRAHEILKETLRTPHPFAHAQLGHDLRRIIQLGANGQHEEEPMEVISKQLKFPQFKESIRRIPLDKIKQGIKKIRYSQSTNLAEAWEIGDGVIISPKVGYGKPVVESEGISTLILANQYFANGKRADLVARIFATSQESVMNAFAFETATIKRIPFSVFN
jgi:uncharacterized protein (DUF433 family)